MLIEIAGLPGSGKTTMFRKLEFGMKAAKLACKPVSSVAAITNTNRKTPSFVRAKPERALLHRYIRFQRRHPKLDALATANIGEKPIRQFLFGLMAAHYQSACDLCDASDYVFIDEGFIAHAVMIFFEANDHKGLKRFIKLAPVLDTVIYVNTPAEIAFSRAVERVGDDPDLQQKAIDKHGELDAFQKRAALLEAALDQYASRGADIIELDGTLHPGVMAKSAKKQLMSLMKASSDG